MCSKRYLKWHIPLFATKTALFCVLPSDPIPVREMIRNANGRHLAYKQTHFRAKEKNPPQIGAGFRSGGRFNLCLFDLQFFHHGFDQCPGGIFHLFRIKDISLLV